MAEGPYPFYDLSTSLNKEKGVLRSDSFSMILFLWSKVDIKFKGLGYVFC